MKGRHGEMTEESATAARCPARPKGSGGRWSWLVLPAGNNEEHGRPWWSSSENSLDQRRSNGDGLMQRRHYDVEKDETNIVMVVVFVGDVRGDRKNSAEF